MQRRQEAHNIVRWMELQRPVYNISIACIGLKPHSNNSYFCENFKKKPIQGLNWLVEDREIPDYVLWFSIIYSFYGFEADIYHQSSDRREKDGRGVARWKRNIMELWKPQTQNSIFHPIVNDSFAAKDAQR